MVVKQSWWAVGEWSCNSKKVSIWLTVLCLFVYINLMWCKHHWQLILQGCELPRVLGIWSLISLPVWVTRISGCCQCKGCCRRWRHLLCGSTVIRCSYTIEEFTDVLAGNMYILSGGVANGHLIMVPEDRAILPVAHGLLLWVVGALLSTLQAVPLTWWTGCQRKMPNLCGVCHCPLSTVFSRLDGLAARRKRLNLSLSTWGTSLGWSGALFCQLLSQDIKHPGTELSHPTD